MRLGFWNTSYGKCLRCLRYRGNRLRERERARERASEQERRKRGERAQERERERGKKKKSVYVYIYIHIYVRPYGKSVKDIKPYNNPARPISAIKATAPTCSPPMLRAPCSNFGSSWGSGSIHWGPLLSILTKVVHTHTYIYISTVDKIVLKHFMTSGRRKSVGSSKTSNSMLMTHGLLHSVAECIVAYLRANEGLSCHTQGRCLHHGLCAHVCLSEGMAELATSSQASQLEGKPDPKKTFSERKKAYDRR